MLKKITLMVGLVFLTLAVQAKETNIPGTYEKGTITLSNDKTIEGYIWNDILNAKNEGGEHYKQYMEDNFMILFQKDKSKNPKVSTVVNIKNLLEDNQTVFENYQENFYGFQEEFTKPSSFGSNVHMAFQTSLLKLIADYNK